jgi:L,D-peptidoglycan transpeptidase YkuD (ErfK/YbiS/YcfS/YnhG family)
LWRTGTSRETPSVPFARLAALLALLGSIAFGIVDGIRDAVVGRSAVRDVAFDPDAVCDITTVEAVAARHPDIRQLVVMATDSFGATRGTVEVAVRTAAGDWRCQRAPQTARFGRNGTRPLPERRSGDGTTPAGVFALGVVTAWDGRQFSIFGNRPDPGTTAPYRSVRPEDCWGATPNTPRYQHVVNLPGCPGPHDEWLAKYGDVYAHAAVIGANLDPISGDAAGEIPFAAAIFLHRHSYAASGAARATSGCVSLEDGDLVGTLRLLDPRLRPHFAIGPTDWLRSTA